MGVAVMVATQEIAVTVVVMMDVVPNQITVAHSK